MSGEMDGYVGPTSRGYEVALRGRVLGFEPTLAAAAARLFAAAAESETTRLWFVDRDGVSRPLTAEDAVERKRRGKKK